MAKNAHLFPLIADERRSMADFFESLTPEQLEHPTLCEGWSVRQVAGHLTTGWNVSLGAFTIGMIKHRGFDRFNLETGRRLGDRPIAEIAADLRTNAAHRFSPPGAGAEAPLADIVMHSADIRRPLGISTSHTPPATLTEVLSRAANPGKPTVFPLKSTTGLRFEATDLDWSSGDGLLVRGSADDLILALSSRMSVFADLSGDGVDELRGRCS